MSPSHYPGIILPQPAMSRQPMSRHHFVTDGFEGGKIKKGEKKNWRLKNGWKNSGLPWSYKLNREKMYFTHP
jgi:hypothetical protein